MLYVVKTLNTAKNELIQCLISYNILVFTKLCGALFGTTPQDEEHNIRPAQDREDELSKFLKHFFFYKNV